MRYRKFVGALALAAVVALLVIGYVYVGAAPNWYSP